MSPIPLYSVIYDVNGGSGSITEGSYVAGATVAISNTEPTRPDQKFVGWHYNGNTYTAGQTFTMPNSNMILIAQWQNIQKYAVSYDSNYGDSNAPIDTKSPYFYGETVVVLDKGGMTRIGYTFVGWAVNQTGQTYAENSIFAITGDVRFYAVWQKDNEPNNNNSNNNNNSGEDKVSVTPTPTVASTPMLTPNELSTSGKSVIEEKPSSENDLSLWVIVLIIGLITTVIAVSALLLRKNSKV
ncbi:MAG: InlB B-repeat-containing protein [Nitrososphaerota archaeon]|jgi:uncharacterized repeat protein (TIGR02543 family)|nr:InlB B-repeat-containing protein [Nitrososphaerota archaeon]